VPPGKLAVGVPARMREIRPIPPVEPPASAGTSEPVPEDPAG